MKKILTILTFLLSLNILPVFAYTTNGMAYSGSAFNLSYGYGNASEWTNWSTTRSNEQGEQSKVFYRSATVTSWNWSSEADHKDKSWADSEAAKHDYSAVTSYNWTHSYDCTKTETYDCSGSCGSGGSYTMSGNHTFANCNNECPQPCKDGSKVTKWDSPISGLYKGTCEGSWHDCGSGTGYYGNPANCSNPQQCYYNTCICYTAATQTCTRTVPGTCYETKTSYKYGYRNRNDSTGWTAWSDWTATKLTESSNTKVEYVTLYSRPLIETKHYSAFATITESINLGTYSNQNYTPATYVSKEFDYQYIPALRVCRLSSASKPYVTQMTLQAYINDVAPLAKKGSNVTLSIKTQGGNVSSYQWQYSTNGASWNNISGAKNADYTLTASSTNNGYKYRCLVNGSVASNIATLTVR